METDMTVGNPLKMMLRFAVPLLLGNIFQQLYAMVDTIIVGKFVGTKALAAVGSTGTITFFIFGFLMGVSNGCTVLTSQKFGAGDMKEMRRTVGNAGIISAGIAIIVTAFSMSYMKWLLTFMHTPEDIFEDAYAYIMIICGGIVATVLYNILAAILRALGNSKTPLYFLIISACLNIILDLVFILNFHMGVKGAAYATVISQGLSGLLCLVYMMKKVPVLHMKADDWALRPVIAWNQLRIGVPMGLQFSITAIGGMMVQSALNLLGSFAVAGFTAATKLENAFQMGFIALSSALATFNAQNIGTKKLDRVKKGFHDSHVIGVIYSVIAGLILFFGGKYLGMVFLSDHLEEVVPMMDQYLKYTAIFFIPLYFVNGLRNGIQGMGYGFLPMCAGIMELFGRAVMAWISTRNESYVGVCLASPVAWVAAAVFLWFMYLYVMKDTEKKLGLGTQKGF